MRVARLPPKSIVSPSFSARGGRTAVSFSQMLHPNPPVRRGRVGRRREPFIERTAFVRLHVAEGYPAQPLQIDDSCGRRANAGKQKALPAVEQQRLVSIDEELVEGNSGWRS